MQVGTVQKLINIFNQSFRELGVVVSLEKLEDLSVTVHRAMTAQARQFHTLEHVFTFVDVNDPIRNLAALYHDIVYFQVDMGFSPAVWEMISPYVHQDNATFVVAEHLSPDDRQVALIMDVFNLLPGHRLSSLAALNEFLSALVMCKQIGGLVHDKDLLRMALCIEATIPFRPFTADGKSHFDVMEERLPAICERFGIELSKEEQIASIKTAVLFANKDIENFGESDPSRFLDNTWNLLPETNAALRMPDVYSISTYRQALSKMDAFFESLDPKTVFNQYRGLPPDDEYQQLTRYAYNNIRIAREFLRIKILGTTILEALAKATGGDAPLSLFLGDLPREGTSIKRLEYFLPEVDYAPWVDQHSVIYRLLETGRTTNVDFDMKNSPLSLFIYRTMAPEKIEQAMERAKEFYAGRLSAHDFLMTIDPFVVQSIARASSIMVYTRRQALLKYAGEGA
ncbi:MAG: hypothetical protein DDG60_07340 [Anaerolineae bacterium]|nr:MAG: hypothetical protein DDG60_07340 [Anaerolineae bacterium]